VWTIVVLAAGIVGASLFDFRPTNLRDWRNATGGRYTGIDTRRVKTICLVIVGMLAGLQRWFDGALHACEARPGIGIELDVIAAVILGGAGAVGRSWNNCWHLIGS